MFYVCVCWECTAQLCIFIDLVSNGLCLCAKRSLFDEEWGLHLIVGIQTNIQTVVRDYAGLVNQLL